MDLASLRDDVRELSFEIEAARLVDSANRVAQRAGFASTLDATSALEGFDVAALASDLESFLASTDAMYADVLAWWLKRTVALRPFPHGAEAHDVTYALALHP